MQWLKRKCINALIKEPNTPTEQERGYSKALRDIISLIDNIEPDHIGDANKKVTAVEWFANQSWKLKVRLENKEISIGEYGVTYVELLKQAKAKEKEQIMNAVNYGDERGKIATYRTAEQYYNETYGSNTEI